MHYMSFFYVKLNSFHVYTHYSFPLFSLYKPNGEMYIFCIHPLKQDYSVT